jgi:hypothetical protein
MSGMLPSVKYCSCETCRRIAMFTIMMICSTGL